MEVYMSATVLIKNFPNRAFAEQAREILQNHQIHCVLKSVDVGILGTSSSGVGQGVDLYVEREAGEKAAELLNALFNGI